MFQHAVTHCSALTRCIDIETQVAAPLHLIGSASDGRPLYQSVARCEPDAAYDIDDDGNWLPRQVTFELLTATAQILGLDLLAVHNAEGGEVYRVLQYDAGGHEITHAAGRLLWLADIKRGGVDFGGGATWTDASSPEDAVRRVLLGEVLA